MPELPEVEAYRRLAESRALDRLVERVDAPDEWILKRGLTPQGVRDALTGRSFTAARRIGKLLLLETDGGPVLGLRFGMTGRLIVDEHAGVDRLLYSSERSVPAWDRFTVVFADGGDMRLRDPRRLGGVELDPDEDRLGADALVVTLPQLRAALGQSTAPLKARLLDQAHVAGVGNLLADEALWRAALAPTRPAGSLTPAEQRRLHKHLVGTVHELIGRGGSHLGDLMSERHPGGVCPRDGAPLTRSTVGGRTSWWCSKHQH